jgi:hypothetical protein
MSRAARFAHTIHLTALGLWLGTLVMAGITAAIVFPTARALDLRLPGYEDYTGDHWRLGAGRIQAQVFTAADFIQLFSCLAAIGTLAYALRSRSAPGKVTSLVRSGALILLLLLLIGQLFFMHPPMDSALIAYWHAAAAGDNAAAAEHLSKFERFHGPATALMAANTALVLIALVVGAWAGVAQNQDRAP